jgi:hypothetical protein
MQNAQGCYLIGRIGKRKGVAAAHFLLLGWRNDHQKPVKQEIETALDDFSGEKN